MDRECYRDIEKIKTIGSTYMAAVGLVPTTSSEVRAAPPSPSSASWVFQVSERRLSIRNLLSACELQAKQSIAAHLCTVSDFAIDMFDVLDAINYQSYNDFVLRVGEWRDSHACAQLLRRQHRRSLGRKCVTENAARPPGSSSELGPRFWAPLCRVPGAGALV